MSTANPFTPNTAGTVAATVAATTAALALNKAGIGQQIMVQSLAGNAIGFINFGDSTVTATVAAGTPILPGGSYTFTVGGNVTHVATIGTAGNTLYFTSGQGGVPT